MSNEDITPEVLEAHRAIKELERPKRRYYKPSVDRLTERQQYTELIYHGAKDFEQSEADERFGWGATVESIFADHEEGDCDLVAWKSALSYIHSTQGKIDWLRDEIIYLSWWSRFCRAQALLLQLLGQQQVGKVMLADAMQTDRLVELYREHITKLMRGFKVKI